jgi:hypothetical protein
MGTEFIQTMMKNQLLAYDTVALLFLMAALSQQYIKDEGDALLKNAGKRVQQQ